MRKPKRVTHYLALFDNGTDEHGVRRDSRTEVKEGDVAFQRNGLVVFGNVSFEATQPIQNVALPGGGAANRSPDDQVLVLKNAAGQIYRYRFSRSDQNWFRLVDAERGPFVFSKVFAEEIADYGYILGVAMGLLWLTSRIFRILRFWAVAAFVFYFIHLFVAAGVATFYQQRSEEVVLRMIDLVWWCEIGVVGVVAMADLASKNNEKFFRKYLPIAFFIGLSLFVYHRFSNQGGVLATAWEFSRFHDERH